MARKLISLIAGILLTVSSHAVRAADGESPAIEYGYPDVSVWTIKRDANGQLRNPLLNLAEIMFDKAGMAWRSRPYPAARLFKHLKEGAIPFTMLVRAPSLEACCLFSKNPVTSTELRIYRRSSAAPIAVQEDLAGKRVITIRGYSYGGLGRYLKDEKHAVQIQEATSHEAAFQLFERNRGDYVVDYTGPAEEVLSDQPIRDITFDVFQRLDVFLVLSKAYPEAPSVLERLEEIVAGLDVPRILESK